MSEVPFWPSQEASYAVALDEVHISQHPEGSIKGHILAVYQVCSRAQINGKALYCYNRRCLSARLVPPRSSSLAFRRIQMIRIMIVLFACFTLAIELRYRQFS